MPREKGRSKPAEKKAEKKGKKTNVEEKAESPKLCVMIRHGESTAQVAGGSLRRSAAYLDAPLSPDGENQARSLAQLRPVPDLIVVSPLTRALQTACLACESFGDVPILCLPGLRVPLLN